MVAFVVLQNRSRTLSLTILLIVLVALLLVPTGAATNETPDQDVPAPDPETPTAGTGMPEQGFTEGAASPGSDLSDPALPPNGGGSSDPDGPDDRPADDPDDGPDESADAPLHADPAGGPHGRLIETLRLFAADAPGPDALCASTSPACPEDSRDPDGSSTRSTGPAPDRTADQGGADRDLARLSVGAASSLAITAMLLSWLAYRIGPTLLGSRLERAEVAAHPARRCMLAHLERHPGATIGELARVAGIGPGRATYHLTMLEREDMVRSRRVHGRRRFFPQGAPRVADEDLARRDLALPDRQTGRIVQLLGRSPGTTLSELARVLGMSPGQTHYHVAKLHEGGLIERVRRGRRVRHYLTATGRSVEARINLPEAHRAPMGSPGEAAPSF